MKQLTTQAIILKRINFSEADRILAVITPEQGRLSLLAKGVRRAKSKLAGGLELFSISDITYIDGRSEIKTIISARLKVHFRNIVSDVTKTMLTYDFLKAFDEITQHGVEQGLFEILSSMLTYLNQDSSYSSVANCWATFNLLKLEGRAINLEQPVNKQKFSDEESYNFSYDDMAFYESEKGLFSPRHIKFVRLIDKIKEPEKLHRVQDFELLSSELNQTFTNLLRLHKT